MDPSPTQVTVAHTAYNNRSNVPQAADERTFTINVINVVPVPALLLAPYTLTPLDEGATETVMVRLATQPAANVNVAVGVSDPSELSAAPASLVFTMANWNTAQPVTLSGVADSLVDGTKQVTAIYDISSTGDSAYNALADVTQSLDVTDEDTADILLTRSAFTPLPTINENGGKATLTVRLFTAAEPGVTVSIEPLYSRVTLASTPFLATLTTLADSATLTLGAVDNTIFTGDRTYGLNVAVLAGPGRYSGFSSPRSGTLTEDDVVAGLALVPNTLSRLDEGATETVMVRLATQPAANVDVAVGVSDPSELTAAPASLEFTMANWNTAQPVTLSGVRDNLADGRKRVTVTYDFSSTGDSVYNALSDVTRSLFVSDVDSASAQILIPPFPTINENGGKATLTIRLSTEAERGVTIAIEPFYSRVTLASSPFLATLTTLADRATLTLGAVDDNIFTGDRIYGLNVDVIGGPGGYAGISYSRFGTLTEDDLEVAVAGLALVPNRLTPLAEGATSTVMVRLATQPAANVNVAVGVSDSSELSAAPASLLFSTTNWNTAQPVTLSGVADSLVDGSKQVTVIYDFSSTGDSVYNALSDVPRFLNVTDEDPAQILLSRSPTSPLPTINENGGKATLTVRLLTAAERGVTVAIEPFYSRVTLASSPILATLRTLADRATLTLGAVDNTIFTGDRTYGLRVAVLAGPGSYAGLSFARFGTLTEDDVEVVAAGLALVPNTLTPLAEGATSTVMVRLATQPGANVDVAVGVSDPSELSAAPASLEFTPVNWNTAQPVTLSGVADSLVDGTKQVAVTYDISSTGDSIYNAMSDVTRSLDVTDEDPAQILIPPFPDINENGGKATLTVRLLTAAERGVTVAIDPFYSRVTLASTPFLATLTTLADRATLTLGAVDNTIFTGDRTYGLHVGVRAGPGRYASLFFARFGTLTEDEVEVVVAGLALDPTLLSNLSEVGTSQVMVNLATQPTNNVTVAVSSSDVGELLVSPASIEFTMANWNSAQPVTLSGVADNVADGSQRVTITYAVSSSDSGYGALAARIQLLEVTDSDMGDQADLGDQAILQVAVADIAAAGLAIDLVSDNVNRGASDGPRAQIGGRSVTGLSASDGVSPPQPPDPWNDSDPWSEPDDARWQNGLGLVPGSGFVLPMSSGASPGTGTRTEMWGGARYSDLSGEPAFGGVRHSYDGDAVAVNVGVTRRYASGTSAGFSVGHSWVDLEVSAAGDDSVVKARRRLVSVHPYVSLTPFPDTRLLLLAGYGNGTLSTVGGEDRKASIRMAAARLERDWKMGGFDLSGKLGFLSVESDLEAETRGAVGALHSRVELEFSKLYSPDAGMTVRPYGSVGYLHEIGSIDTDGGVELGAGLRGAWIGGLDVDISALYQIDGAKRSERKLQGHMSFDVGLDGRGLLLDASQEHSLSVEADGSTSLESEYTVRLGHGWGRTLWRRHGVLGAYVSTVEGSGGDVFHGPRLGLSFEAASLELIVEQGFGEGRIHLNFVSSF